ncbi:bifunctional succinylornithine transaminase/acetylornithine transaminase [Janthinobacterium sp. BJB1]|uniref:acetylornithine/succinylornithine family transaminase n=1 Tax=Janthinobacterium sp. GW458P TaxID=1981504 RepID=UPI000A31FC56|nr:acetylornithine/succinylornithine family transaminase [Janthinobacterium sp. GW458P]MBE3027817.1 acetylornithine/succinylornithine family transaminase [Janthinobacterium sp. GW458P]PHV18194.1 bifunctional succinylornithine transaminase/acetylornithine transaminase [Janthinobacterium sp. BJB303]PJC98969.1 bifunctional succinylornithine transaminase/acetylornithine transaminase [Janthinobacterium sp. BJB1]
MNAKLDSTVTARPVTRETFDQVLVPTYAPAAMVPVRASGLDLWDQSGKHYLDFTSGIAVTSLGHCNPALVDVLTKQINSLWHLGNGYTNEPVLRLALALTEATFADRAFFCNSGAEANEAALKLARKYAHTKFGAHKSRIISCFSSFHGRTLFTVSVGGQAKYTEGFEPLPQEINHIAYNDIEAARAAIGDDVCAVIVEPVQGEGGVVPGNPEFLKELRALCDKTGALLIFDEVQSGMGRTGALFAYMGYGVTPDILTAAKALGNGYPIGAMLTTNELAQTLAVGTHGTTYGGNPLAATVALKVLEMINTPAFLARVKEASVSTIAMLQGLITDYPQVFSVVRGSGLLLGLVVSDAYKGRAKDIQKAAEAQGLMVLIAGMDVVRLAPALIVSDEQIVEAGRLLRAAIDGMLKA